MLGSVTLALLLAQATAPPPAADEPPPAAGQQVPEEADQAALRAQIEALQARVQALDAQNEAQAEALDALEQRSAQLEASVTQVYETAGNEALARIERLRVIDDVAPVFDDLDAQLVLGNVPDEDRLAAYGEALEAALRDAEARGASTEASLLRDARSSVAYAEQAYADGDLHRVRLGLGLASQLSIEARDRAAARPANQPGIPTAPADRPPPTPHPPGLLLR